MEARIEMTAHQLKGYDFVREHIAACGVSPSYQEIADHLGLRSKSGIVRLVDRLVADGKLVKAQHAGSRKLRLPGTADLTTVSTEALQSELMRRGAALGALSVKSVPLLGRVGASCAAGQCAVGLKPGMMYCRQHWFVLPIDVQEALKQAHGRSDLAAFSAAKVKADDIIAKWRGDIA
jgi:hypothetical protein